jgi:hypothetical protein
MLVVSEDGEHTGRGASTRLARSSYAAFRHIYNICERAGGWSLATYFRAVHDGLKTRAFVVSHFGRIPTRQAGAQSASPDLSRNARSNEAAPADWMTYFQAEKA